MAPAQVVRWIKQAYPKPMVNAEWLDACCAWIADEMHLNPTTQTEAFLVEVENQLLESDLCDSMELNTGLPLNAPTMNNIRIRGTPILVEVTSITEIGHSAFNLHNVRQARVERADLAGLAQEEGGGGEDGEDEGPVPNYPRSMLKFEISDGSVTMPAIEYRAIPQLKLDETPLGFKILLKDVLVRRGIIFLEPQGIVLKGHKNNERDEFRERDFVRGLFRRMMKPVPEDEQPADDDENHPPPRGPPPVLPPAQAVTKQAQAHIRSPLREISEPPEPRADGMDVDDDADLPRKRRIPNPNPNPMHNMHPPPPSPSSASTLVASHFFTGSSRSSSSSATAKNASTRQLSRVLSPVRGDPIDITDSSMEDPADPQPPSVPSGSSFATAATRTTGTIGKQSSVITGPARTTPALRSKISYEEFEFDDDDAEMDAAFLDEIAKVEKEALALGNQKVSQVVRRQSQSQSHMHARVMTSNSFEVRGSGVSYPTTASSSASSSISASHAHRPHVQPHVQVQTKHAPTPTPTPTPTLQDVITIEDDEDGEDKENVPVPKRRVRRRVSAAFDFDFDFDHDGGGSGVIDISD